MHRSGDGVDRHVARTREQLRHCRHVRAVCGRREMRAHVLVAPPGAHEHQLGVRGRSEDVEAQAALLRACRGGERLGGRSEIGAPYCDAVDPGDQQMRGVRHAMHGRSFAVYRDDPEAGGTSDVPPANEASQHSGTSSLPKRREPFLEVRHRVPVQEGGPSSHGRRRVRPARPVAVLPACARRSPGRGPRT